MYGEGNSREDAQVKLLLFLCNSNQLLFLTSVKCYSSQNKYGVFIDLDLGFFSYVFPLCCHRVVFDHKRFFSVLKLLSCSALFYCFRCGMGFFMYRYYLSYLKNPHRLFVFD